MARVTVGVARLRALTAQWPWVPSIGQNLQPFTCNCDVSIFSCGMINLKQTNKTPRIIEIIETDFRFAISLAMTHAACRAFSSCDLLTYLTRCWDTIHNANTMPARLTVLHICAALLLKIFQRMVVQSTEKSKTRKFWLYVLARLQSSSSLEMATYLMEDFTTV